MLILAILYVVLGRLLDPLGYLSKGMLSLEDGHYATRLKLPKVKELRPEVPVIMITAYGDADTKRKALERGASGLLTKPIDFAQLREEIDTRVAAAN